jgi:hypothetical protein
VGGFPRGSSSLPGRTLEARLQSGFRRLGALRARGSVRVRWLSLDLPFYVYDGSKGTVTNNWCWNVAARCYQIRGGTGGSWRNNVSDNANYRFMFGDNTPTNVTASNNIVGPDIASTQG